MPLPEGCPFAVGAPPAALTSHPRGAILDDKKALRPEGQGQSIVRLCLWN